MKISFKHCFRDANQVAHQLARHAFVTKQFLVWDGGPPGFILPYVINDVTLFDDNQQRATWHSLNKKPITLANTASLIPLG
jgi:hypothetical protein